jgi:hypothetical protein
MKTENRLIEVLESRIAPAFAGIIDLGTINGANAGKAFRVAGADTNDMAGSSVSAAGDFNGDGYGDFVIGAPNAGGGAGKAYLVFGDATSSPAVNLSALNGTTGFALTGDAGDKLGFSVGAAGDVNGDGFDDVVIGAPGANGGDGAGYIVFGKSSGFTATADIDTQISNSGGFLLKGQPNNGLGASVSGVGDLNGDGFADVAVGKPTGVAGFGGVDVIYGRPTAAFGAPIVDLNLNGSNGFQIYGDKMGDLTGSAVAGAGDVNGDGFDDLILGAPGASPGAKAGAGSAYVVYGHKGVSSPTPLDLTQLTAAKGFRIDGLGAGDGLGASVSGVGDFNRDGFDDFVLGTTDPTPGAQTGESYVVFGHKTFGSSLNLSTGATLLNHNVVGDKTGVSVSGAGDVNGDGYADLIIGAPGVNGGGVSNTGGAFVLFGNSAGLPSTFSLNSIDGTNGFRIQGAAVDDAAGMVVSNAGDVNGDGFDDLLVGAPGVNANGSPDAGAAYVVYGSNGDNHVTISADGKTATYTDVDGDLVTIKTSKGALSEDDFLLSGANSLGGSTLRKVDFNGDADLAGANISIVAKPQKTGGVKLGDGLVNVGLFDAGNVKLGKVKIGGDLSKVVGDSMKSLSLNSFGLEGLTTQAGQGSNNISFIGSIGALNVKTSIDGISFITGKIGTMKVGGDFENSVFTFSGTSSPAKQSQSVVLKSLTVGGDLDHTRILGGYGFIGNNNADVSIGKVVINGDWIESSLVAGVSSGNDQFLGTNDDALFAGGNAVVAKIASVVIKGQALGSIDPGGHFAITAESIGSVKVGGTKLSLNPKAKDSLIAIGATGDFVVNEVA